MKLNVIKQRNLWWTISVLLTVAGLAAMAISWSQIQSPLRPALDFIGGTRLQFELDCSVPQNCARPIDISKVREIMSAQNQGDTSIQPVGDHGISIRGKTLNVEERTKLENALKASIGQFDPKKTQIDTVGPTIGKELFIAGLLALIVSFFGITVYLTFRFQFDYAFFAIVALLHDVLITVGVFALLGLIAKVEVDSLFLVALLTIIGFSVNDTVVIYDRIRENLEKYPETSLDQIVDDSVNQTLSRSINTSLTAQLPLLAILIFGGQTLKFFSLALIVGFASGAYSSIFIASTLLAWWRNRQKKSILPKSQVS
jgi:preprotein translocase subunit SecF